MDQAEHEAEIDKVSKSEGMEEDIYTPEKARLMICVLEDVIVRVDDSISKGYGWHLY